jgi:type II secretory pathway component PulK
MALMVVGIIVAQVAARVNVEYMRLDARVRERQCSRALDSAVGLAVRSLTEDVADLRVDHLGDEWTRAKVFIVGDVRVEISIEDCARRYDLQGLLEEDTTLLDANREQFVAFAVHCGVEETAARNLAEAIIAEAEIRRLEDEVDTETADTTEGAEGEDAATDEQGVVPVWLEDFLSLSQLTDEDRQAIRAAAFLREDPETFEQTTVPFMDLVTIWRYDRINVNTAPREVLLYGLPGMSERETEIDDLIAQRKEEPFLNTAQIQSLTGLDQDQARQVVRYCRLNSRRFRVTARATLLTASRGAVVRPATMTIILDRSGSNVFEVLWRSKGL